jgi:hypothetical protein
MRFISGSINVLSSISGRFFLLTFFVFCFLFQLELKGAPASVEVKGLNVPSCHQVSNGFLVYGVIPDPTNTYQSKGFQVDIYNKDLVKIESYTKTFKGFNAPCGNLFYYGTNDLEFLLHDLNKNSWLFIRLDSTLKEIFVSAPFEHSKERDDSVFFFNFRHLSGTISFYRDNNSEWEIRNDSVNTSGGKKIRKTFLRKSTEIKQETFPAFHQDWKLELSPANPEHAKFLFADKGRIYFYVNFKTGTGEQYLYCIQNSDGKLIYKTKLSIAGVKSCIYSNFYNDTKNNSIILSGTCLYSIGKNARPGIFLIQLNETGKISGSYNENYRSFSFPKPDSTFNKNSLTDSRIVSMASNSDGSFSVFIEAYALLAQKIKDKNGVGIKFPDSLYHYFMLEKMTFKISATTINLICSNCQNSKLEYGSQININDIAAYDSKVMRLSNQNFPDNINAITDPSYDKGILALRDNLGGIFSESTMNRENQCFVGSTFDENTKQTKVLTSYFFSGSERFSSFYFSSETTGQNNFDAFQYLVPVAGQNMNEEKSYFIRDSKTLIKFWGTQTSYKLEIVNW